VIQLISDAYQSTDDDLVSREIELLGRIAAEVGRPLSFTVQQSTTRPIGSVSSSPRSMDGTTPEPTSKPKSPCGRSAFSSGCRQR